jgi:hypothetical protein
MSPLTPRKPTVFAILGERSRRIGEVLRLEESSELRRVERLLGLKPGHLIARLFPNAPAFDFDEMISLSKESLDIREEILLLLERVAFTPRDDDDSTDVVDQAAEHLFAEHLVPIEKKIAEFTGRVSP